MKRSAGILLHISSLASPWGIGTMGDAAFRFVDFLHDAGIRFWQVLPLNPVGESRSPYQSESAFAGNPLLLDLEGLVSDGLLGRGEIASIHWGTDPRRVDYAAVSAGRNALLRRAFARATPAMLAQSQSFARRTAWLDDYALFAAIQNDRAGTPFWEWPQALALREEAALEAERKRLAPEISYQIFVQHLFDRQFSSLRDYAARRGVSLIGDLPIYVSEDSADVWANRGLFLLEENGRPALVAGVGPDAFSAEGQRWGNPLYRWEAVAADEWRWWIARLKDAFARFDLVRIDHFRGFESYWAIPATAASAREGEWRKGPGMMFFDTMRFVFGQLPLIAEDLGILTPQVHALREQAGLPGMKVLQFAFNPGAESDYLPHRHVRHAVCCTGTHDNDTLRGWLDSLDTASAAFCRAYLGAEPGGEMDALLRAAWGSACDLTVVPMQDVLGLGTEARMNTPGTVGAHNWSWRMAPDAPFAQAAARLRALGELYFRI